MLIEHRGLRFILCGSSARKLKRGRANLLGGRAWRFEMFPLVTAEFPAADGPHGRFDLLRALNHGLLPSHYLSSHPRRSLEAVGYSHGELVNYANIARDCRVDAKTVKEHFQILCDTLLGRLVPPYKKRQERQVISKAPKFYLFDVGVAGALAKRHLAEPRGEQFGRALEHLVFMELAAHASYRELGAVYQAFGSKRTAARSGAPPPADRQASSGRARRAASSLSRRESFSIGCRSRAPVAAPRPVNGHPSPSNRLPNRR